MCGYELCGHMLFYSEDGSDKLIESQVCIQLLALEACRGTSTKKLCAAGLVLQCPVSLRPQSAGHTCRTYRRPKVMAWTGEKSENGVIYRTRGNCCVSLVFLLQTHLHDYRILNTGSPLFLETVLLLLCVGIRWSNLPLELCFSSSGILYQGLVSGVNADDDKR